MKILESLKKMHGYGYSHKAISLLIKQETGLYISQQRIGQMINSEKEPVTRYEIGKAILNLAMKLPNEKIT